MISDRNKLENNSDTNVLNEYKIINQPNEFPKNLFGRWSNYDYVEFEHSLVILISRFHSNEDDAVENEFSNLRAKIDKISSDSIIDLGYLLLFKIATVIKNLKSGMELVSESISSVIETINRLKLETNLDFNLLSNLKSAAFIANTVGFYSILLFKIANSAMPQSASSKKKKKGKSGSLDELRTTFSGFLNEYLQFISQIKLSILSLPAINPENEEQNQDIQMISKLEGLSVESTFMKIRNERLLIGRVLAAELENVIVLSSQGLNK